MPDVVVNTDAPGNYDVQADVWSVDLDEATALEMCDDGNGFSEGIITIEKAAADNFDDQVLFDNGCGNAPTINILADAAP
ncbi:hypothetical protein GN155_011930 [Alcanivorax sp. ZXX171]|nr:hypothetical protein [Alcanivorax sp. ZXX171]